VYNEANQKVFAIDARGDVTQTWYDADGRVTSIRAYATALTAAQLSALGTAPSMAAVSADLTATVNDPISYTAYNAEGQVRYQIDPLGYVTETRYDSADRMSEVLTYPGSVSLSPTVATALQQSQATALSTVASLVSSAGNTDANAQAKLYLYDGDSQVRFVVQQNTVNGQLVGLVSEQRYDAAGRVTATVAYGGTLILSTTQALSAQLSTSSVTQSLASAANHTTYSVYDNAGRVVYTIDATSHVTQTQYDGDGRVLQTIAYANGIALPGTLTVTSIAGAVSATNSGTTGARITSTTYDAAGRVTATGDALGINARYTYDATGLRLTFTNRDGATWTYGYDAAGRKTLEQSPLVTVGNNSSGTAQAVNQYLYTTYAYDGVGNVTAISKGTGPNATQITVLSTTGYTYDAAGHQIATTYPGGVSTHVAYNALGQAVVDQDANGHYQYKTYDLDGRVAYSIDADGYVSRNTYDAYGNVLAATRYATTLNTSAIAGWGAGQALTYAQIQSGLVTSGSDRTITTTYDQGNQKLQVQQSSISYNISLGSLWGGTATAAPTTTFTYDAYGNVTSIAVLIQGSYTSGTTTTPAVWATTYNYYDALNRAVVTVTPTGLYTNPQGYVTTTTYDAFGDVQSTTQYATAIGTSGITTVTAPGLPPAGNATSGYDRTTTFQYDSIGRKTSETDSGEYSYTGGTPGQLNGSAGIAASSSVTQYTYDGENRVTSITVTFGLRGATTMGLLIRPDGVCIRLRRTWPQPLRTNIHTRLRAIRWLPQEQALDRLISLASRWVRASSRTSTWVANLQISGIRTHHLWPSLGRRGRWQITRCRMRSSVSPLNSSGRLL
jgi:YD repeat-containing protein